MAITVLLLVLYQTTIQDPPGRFLVMEMQVQLQQQQEDSHSMLPLWSLLEMRIVQQALLLYR